MLTRLTLVALLLLVWNQAVIADIPTASTELEKIQQAELVYFSSRSPGTMDMLSFKIASVLETCQKDFEEQCADVQNPDDRRRRMGEREAHQERGDEGRSLVGFLAHSYQQKMQEWKEGLGGSDLASGQAPSEGQPGEEEEMQEPPSPFLYHHQYMRNRPHPPPSFSPEKTLPKGSALRDEAFYQRGEQPHHINQYHAADIKNALLASRSDLYFDRRGLKHEGKGEEGKRRHHFDHHHDFDKHVQAFKDEHKDHFDHHFDHHHDFDKHVQAFKDEHKDHFDHDHFDHHDFDHQISPDTFKPSHAASPYKTTRNTPPPMGFGVYGDKCLFAAREEVSSECSKSIANLEGYMAYNINNFYGSQQQQQGEEEGGENSEEQEELRRALFSPPFYLVLVAGFVLYALVSCGRTRKRKAALEDMLQAVWANATLKAMVEQQMPTRGNSSSSSQSLPQPLTPAAKTWGRIRRYSVLAMAVLLIVGLVTVNSASYREKTEEEQEQEALYDDKDYADGEDKHGDIRDTKVFLRIIAFALCLSALLFVISLFKSKDLCCPNRRQRGRRGNGRTGAEDVQYIALQTFDSDPPSPPSHHQHQQVHPYFMQQQQQQQQQQGPIHVYSGVPVSSQPSGHMV